MKKPKEIKNTVIPYSRWVLITGCDSGFGSLAARQLLARGHGVIAVCLTEAGCERLRAAAPIPERLHTLRCDITEPADIERLQGELSAYRGGRLWALVNNAGIAIPGPLDYLSESDFRQVMEVNLFGAINLTRICLPLLKESRGRVVNICSSCSLLALSGNGPYNTSKFALRGFTDTLRREVAVWGIKVALIAPGVMRTPMPDGYLNTLQNKFDHAPREVQQAYGEKYQQKVFSTTATQMRTMAQDPQLAVDAILHAVTSRHPKSMYLPGMDAKLFNTLGKQPAWYADRFVKADGGVKPVAVLQRGTRIVEYTCRCAADQAATWSCFVDLLWKHGAGLTPKMTLEEEGDATGNGCTRWIPIFGKNGIREQITATDSPRRLDYQVKNPSWITFPVDYHRGWVDFVPLSQASTQVVWSIELTPKRGMAGVVYGMLGFIIPRYLKTLTRACQPAS